ncbi:MAG: ParB/RepB/Spo0J family partition protein [Parachlamydiaceae bacterium]|nr:ParB/RepB/Spo0J family partition protein [Parachlamydiaceae bacterium]
MPAQNPSEENECSVMMVDLKNIHTNPYQPRRHFSPNELEELAQSIKSVGLIHPPLVRVIDENNFELVSGERRFQASKLAGLTSIPVLIKSKSICQSAQMALIENIQRVDLNAIEIAQALQRLLEEFDFNQEELAGKIGKKRSTVANYLRLLSLPENIQQSLLHNYISMGHAKAILALEGDEKQNLLHELILRDDLSVREAETTAARIAQKVKKQSLGYVNRNFFHDQLAEKLQRRLGTKVHLLSKGKGGRIYIDYYNLNDLDRLLHIFGVNEND